MLDDLSNTNLLGSVDTARIRVSAVPEMLPQSVRVEASKIGLLAQEGDISARSSDSGLEEPTRAHRRAREEMTLHL